MRYWIGFNLVPGIGPARLRSLLDHFGDIESAWQADSRELREAGLDKRSLESPISTRKEVPLEEGEDRVAQAGAKAITWEDGNYPPRQRHIHNPPPLLYVRGEILPENETESVILSLISQEQSMWMR